MSFAFSRGRVEALTRVDFAAVNRLLDEMESEGRGLLATASVPGDAIELIAQAAMRYVGQGHEIDVTLPRESVRAGDAPAIAIAFEQVYRRHFGRGEPGAPIEIVSWRLGVRGPRPPIALAQGRGPARRDGAGASLTGYRAAWCPTARAFIETPVHDRYRFTPGCELTGPALLEERESTVVVPSGARAWCDASLNLVIELPGERSAA